MPSFDIVCKTDLAEIENVLNGVRREITTRYDFKGSKATLERTENEITVLADDDVKLRQIQELLRGYATRRSLDHNCLAFGKTEDASGAMVRQFITVQEGIDRDLAKKIIKKIKDAKIKVQTQVQGDELRVNGKKRDDLQQAIQLVKEIEADRPLKFENFRD